MALGFLSHIPTPPCPAPVCVYCHRLSGFFLFFLPFKKISMSQKERTWKNPMVGVVGTAKSWKLLTVTDQNSVIITWGRFAMARKMKYREREKSDSDRETDASEGLLHKLFTPRAGWTGKDGCLFSSDFQDSAMTLLQRIRSTAKKQRSKLFPETNQEENHPSSLAIIISRSLVFFSSLSFLNQYTTK